MKINQMVLFKLQKINVQQHHTIYSVVQCRLSHEWIWCWPINQYRTRKLCYRKDDRAIRPIHECPENFWDSLTMPTATIPNIFHELLFGSTLWMFLSNLKSVALSVPEIIRGTQKIWTVPGYAHAPFSRKFFIGFYSDWPYKCTRQICSP